MSRNYEVEVEIYPLLPEALDEAAKLLGCQGVDDIDFDEVYQYPPYSDPSASKVGGGCFTGHINLGGGMDEKSQHREFVEAFPDKRLTSRWRYLEDRPWDHEFIHDPDDEEDDENDYYD